MKKIFFHSLLLLVVPMYVVVYVVGVICRLWSGPFTQGFWHCDYYLTESFKDSYFKRKTNPPTQESAE